MTLSGTFSIPDEQFDLAQQLLHSIEVLNRRMVEPFTWLDTQGAADRLGVSPSTIRKWLDEGWLTGVQIGSVLRFRSDKLDAAFEQRGEFRATHPALIRKLA